MARSEKIDRICVIVTILAILVTVLFMNGERLGIRVAVDEDAEGAAGSSRFTANDLNGAWDDTDAVKITLSDAGTKIRGNGAYLYDGDVVISQSGLYSLSGTLTNGRVVVNANANSKVWLAFHGVDITCADGAALLVEQADKVFLTLTEGSENRLASGAEYGTEAVAGNVKGTLFSRDDLTINGSGSLTIAADYRHGIDGNDDLVITGGRIAIDAPGDAIHVNNCLKVCNAELTLTAGDEGVDVDNEGGYFYMESGTVDIRSTGDGVHTEDSFTLTGGTLSVSAGDDGIHAANLIDISGGTLDITECYEGLEGFEINISGGDTTICPSDDGLNATDGSTSDFGFGGGGGGMGGGGMGRGFGGGGSLSGNDFRMGGFAMSGQSDGENSLSFGDFGGERPAEGPEASPGESGAEASDTSEESEERGLPVVNISGGSLTIINTAAHDADGIDSNGDINITGGTIRVAMSTGGYAMDVGSESGGVMEISGGNLIGLGAYAMAESFDATSAQCSMLYTLSEGAEAGTTVALEDADGSVIISYEAPCAFNCINLSCPELVIGGTYLMVVGDNVEEITIEEVSASYGDAQSSMFGGTMNWGGMQPRGSFGGMGGGHGRMGGRHGSASDNDAGGGEGAMPGAEERPEGGGMPGPSDGDGTAFERPEMGGEMQPPEEMRGESAEDGSAQGDASEEEASAASPGTILLLLLASAAVMLAGLLFAFLFRGRRIDS